MSSTVLPSFIRSVAFRKSTSFPSCSSCFVSYISSVGFMLISTSPDSCPLACKFSNTRNKPHPKTFPIFLNFVSTISLCSSTSSFLLLIHVVVSSESEMRSSTATLSPFSLGMSFLISSSSRSYFLKMSSIVSPSFSISDIR